MSIIYDVPMVRQIDTNLCWHASAEMIWQYWQQVTARQGPMNTLLQKYAGNRALPVREARLFAEKVGLKAVIDRPVPFYFNSSEIIEDALRKFGPLWCGGNWYGSGHVIVLTGIDAEQGQVHLNDPGSGGIWRTESVAWFNLSLYSDKDGCVLHKDPDSY
jgi:hypothetical protein